MGTRSSTPDLFAFASNRATSAASANPSSTPPANAAAPASVSRYVLPADLQNAMKQLEDTELDRLLSAVIAEQNRRGKKLAVSHEGSRKRRIKSCSLAMFAGILRASSFVKQLCSR